LNEQTVSIDHILATKLVIPAMPLRVVPRARLMHPQDAPRLILVRAPAGYGKTTLIASWVKDMPASVAWLSLDGGDNDSLRFLMHFITAIQAHYPDFGATITGMLGNSPLPSVGEMMRSLVNQLCSVKGRLCLILDDLHLVSDAAVHQAIAFLVDNQPPQLQLIVAGRCDPPFSLARLRGQRQILEYRAGDLRFTSEEVGIFCNDLMQLGLPQQQIETLAQRTEGWIAGVQLAAASMHSIADKARFIDSFAGDNRHITDFLLDEVLRSRSEDMQAFLLHTSVLERFNAPLCDAVTGRADSCLMLDEMERANMFIVGLDHQRCWYRYHHLFMSLLQSRLRSGDPDLAKTLCRRASDWCDTNGLLSDAIDYAIKAEDFVHATDLMERHGNELFSHGQIGTVLSWARLLPVSLLAQRPALSMMCAWAGFYTDDLLAMDRYIRMVAACIDGFGQAPFGSSERAMWGQLALMRGCRLAYDGDIDGAKIQLHIALASLRPERTLHRAASVYLGVICLVAGELDQAQPLLAQHASIAQVKYNALVPITAVLGLARLHLLRGYPVAAQQVYKNAMREALTVGLHDYPACGMLHIGLGELAYQMNDLKAAEQHLRRGVEMTAVGMQYVNAWGRILLAQTRLAAGTAGAEIDTETEALLARYAGRFVVDLPPLSAATGQLYLSRNRIDELVQWVDAGQLPLEAPLAIGREAEYLVLARYFIASRQPASSLALLDAMLPAAEQGKRQAVVIEIGILKAIALQAQGKISEALAALQQSVALAEHTRLVRLFINDGAALRGLLVKLVRGSDCTAFVHSLLNHIAPESCGKDDGASHPLLSMFSKKEKEVVMYIAKGNSNQEIAQALFISSNTIHSHMKSIYAKLGVNSRLQAIERLRELGMAC
jgi:LuxR family maltose regulon positive regulatory protein